ncbi:MAG: NRDE family protein [Candidatus Kapaibacterium sp.]|nr:MAG: NRDE family protein [Candidatus Kapabacteria bacterium]
MCLLLFALDAHPAYKLVLAANRDEFTARPSHEAHFWHDYPNVLGGRDEEAGGTWLGITQSGRFTALTNFRDIANINPNAPSRGRLTQTFLTHPEMSTSNFAALLERTGTLYNGFNILWGDFAADASDFFWYSNYTSETYNRSIHKISSGIHGVSNALFDTPWFKLERGKELLKQALERSLEHNHTPDHLSSALLAMMRDDHKPTDEQLPKTGVSLEWERVLSSMFIETPDKKYGTRCTTILLIDRANTVHFREYLSMPPDGKNAAAFTPKEQYFHFQLAPDTHSILE